jgi:biotin operon repressor
MSRPRSNVLSDMDLHTLFYGYGERAQMKELVTMVRAMARGALEHAVSTSKLARRLDWSESKVRRIRRKVQDAGIIVVQQPNRRGDYRSNLWVLDRRRVAALQDVLELPIRPADSDAVEQGVVSPVAEPFVVENSSEEEPLRASSSSESQRPPQSDTRPPAPDDPPNALDAPAKLPLPAALVEPELSELRRWIKQRAGQSSTGSRAERVELLDRARQFLEISGASKFRVAAAARVLELELLVDQLELDEGEAA